jgi:hypothetical protein
MKTSLAFALAGVTLASSGLAADAGVNPARAQVVSQLRAQHLRMRLDGTFKYAFFVPRARAYWNARGEVILWQFPSAVRGARGAARIRPDGNAIGGRAVLWKGLPHWFHRGRVIALYIGSNAAVQTALVRVLGAQIAGSP